MLKGRRNNVPPLRPPNCGAGLHAPGWHAGSVLFVVALSLTAVLAADAWRPLKAQVSTARIVGLGATTCQQFNGEVKANPLLRRDYFAWAQGFMSGIILSRPPGIDEGLDLAPATFDLVTQVHVIEDYCSRNVSLDFSDAVKALYKRLRQEGKT